MEQFTNDYPGEDICPFCGQEIDPIEDREIAAEDDGAFWVERICESCQSRWRDYYDPDGIWKDTCPECGSNDIEASWGEIEYNCARSSGECRECGESWINYYTYSFSDRYDYNLPY